MKNKNQVSAAEEPRQSTVTDTISTNATNGDDLSQSPTPEMKKLVLIDETGFSTAFIKKLLAQLDMTVSGTRLIASDTHSSGGQDNDESSPRPIHYDSAVPVTETNNPETCNMVLSHTVNVAPFEHLVCSLLFDDNFKLIGIASPTDVAESADPLTAEEDRLFAECMAVIGANYDSFARFVEAFRVIRRTGLDRKAPDRLKKSPSGNAAAPVTLSSH